MTHCAGSCDSFCNSSFARAGAARTRVEHVASTNCLTFMSNLPPFYVISETTEFRVGREIPRQTRPRTVAGRRRVPVTVALPPGPVNADHPDAGTDIGSVRPCPDGLEGLCESRMPQRSHIVYKSLPMLRRNSAEPLLRPGDAPHPSCPQPKIAAGIERRIGARPSGRSRARGRSRHSGLPHASRDPPELNMKRCDDHDDSDPSCR